MSGLISQAESYVSSNIPSMSSITSSLSSFGSSTLSGLLNPPGPIPLAANATSTQVNPGYIVTFSGTDEMGKPIGPVPEKVYTQSQLNKPVPWNPNAPVSGIIQAYLPEMFDIGTYSHWQPLSASADLVLLASLLSGGKSGSSITTAAAGFAGAMVPGVASTTQAFTGYTAQIPQLSQMFWTSSDPLTFNLNLQINAVYSAKTEVTNTIASLLALTLPSVDVVGTFRAPGPSLLPGGNYGSQYNVNMAIGGNWLFPNVIIQNVSASFDVLPTVSGDYISATVHVQVSTSRMYSKTDLYTAMGNNPNPTSTTSPGTIQSLLSSVNSLANKGVSTVEGAASSAYGAVSGAASQAGNYISSYL